MQRAQQANGHFKQVLLACILLNFRKQPKMGNNTYNTG
jgi:hypothetical protein